MAQPTLDERFRNSTPKRAIDDHHAWLNAGEQRIIRKGFKERWSSARIGRALGINEAAVRRFRDRCWVAPGVLLELGLIEMTGRAKGTEYRCLVFADRVKCKKEEERHLLRSALELLSVEDLSQGTCKNCPLATRRLYSF